MPIIRRRKKMMRRIWNLVLLIFLLQCFSLNAWGQGAKKNENTELESMTVIGETVDPEEVEVSSRFLSSKKRGSRPDPDPGRY